MGTAQPEVRIGRSSSGSRSGARYEAKIVDGDGAAREFRIRAKRGGVRHHREASGEVCLGGERSAESAQTGKVEYQI